MPAGRSAGGNGSTETGVAGRFSRAWGRAADCVPNSPPTIEDELGTPVGDAPVVRMVSQEIVREAFYLCTPGDPRQTLHNRYSRARDRAEQRGLISAGNVGGITYLWLTRPDPEDIEAEHG